MTIQNFVLRMCSLGDNIYFQYKPILTEYSPLILSDFPYFDLVQSIKGYFNTYVLRKAGYEK